MFLPLAAGVLSNVPSVLLMGLAIAFAFSVIAGILFIAAERMFGAESDDWSRREAGTGGEDRRRAEIREYLDDIDERYVEDDVVRDQRVAFFLPDRDVAVTFDARTYFRIEGRSAVPDGGRAAPTPGNGELGDSEQRNAMAAEDGRRIRAVLCEHEMHGHNLGGRLPFEVPEVERFREPRGSDGVRAAYAALDLTPGASVDAVTAAYRERVKDAHPDHGGSEAAFKSLRAAYSTAKTHAAATADTTRASDGAVGVDEDGTATASAGGTGAFSGSRRTR